MDNQDINNVQFIRYSEGFDKLFTKFKAYKVVKYEENLAAFIVINDKGYESVLPIECCIIFEAIDQYCLCDYPDVNSSDTFSRCHSCQRSVLI